MQPKPLTRYLKQRHLLFGSREFIIQGHALLIRERALFSRHETQIPLKTLQPTPTWASSFALNWLLISLFMATACAGVSFLAHQLELNALYLFSAVLAGTTVVLIYRFFLYTTNLVIFRHAISHENYLYLWRDRPNKKQFQGFIDTLSGAIRKTTPP